MGFDRKELKARAKALLKANYWPMVGAALVLAIVTYAAAANSGTAQNAEEITDEAAYRLTGMLAMLIALAGAAIKIFVFNPLEFGGRRFFVRNIEGQSRDTLFEGFRTENHMRASLTFLLRDLYILLFTFLLIVPGIIKAYEYYFVPELLSDHPELNGKDVLDLSKEMTNGMKMELFKLDLSFILWSMLSGITYNIAGIFFVFPYKAQTRALAYAELVDRGADPAR